MEIVLRYGDCLDVMQEISNKSVDCIICDLPYGVTKNTWDSMIDLDSLWKEYKRIIKENGAIILFGQDKFTAKVMLSNESWHRYNLIWNKELASGFLNAKRMPLRSHEDIMIFYKKLPTYNPQMVKGKPNHTKGTVIGKQSSDSDVINNNYGNYTIVENVSDMHYPKSILTYQKPHPSVALHPTQKPVELIEWLIKTYTNEGDLILDNCMGSGTTGVACKNLNRNFFGIEKDKKYFNIAKERIYATQEK